MSLFSILALLSFSICDFISFPIQKVQINLSIEDESRDLTPKNRIRNDTSIYVLDGIEWNAKIDDGNLAFWDSLLSKARIRPNKDELVGTCMCECNRAEIIITDSKSNPFKFRFEDCDSSELIFFVGKKQFWLSFDKADLLSLSGHIQHCIFSMLQKVIIVNNE